MNDGSTKLVADLSGQEFHVISWQYIFKWFYHRQLKLIMWLLWLNLTATNVRFIEFVWEINFRPKYTKIKLWICK